MIDTASARQSPGGVLRSEYIIRHAALTLGSPLWLAEELFFVPTKDEKPSGEYGIYHFLDNHSVSGRVVFRTDVGRKAK